MGMSISVGEAISNRESNPNDPTLSGSVTPSVGSSSIAENGSASTTITPSRLTSVVGNGVYVAEEAVPGVPRVGGGVPKGAGIKPAGGALGMGFPTPSILLRFSSFSKLSYRYSGPSQPPLPEGPTPTNCLTLSGNNR